MRPTAYSGQKYGIFRTFFERRIEGNGRRKPRLAISLIAYKKLVKWLLCSKPTVRVATRLLLNESDGKADGRSRPISTPCKRKGMHRTGVEKGPAVACRSPAPANGRRIHGDRRSTLLVAWECHGLRCE